MSILVVCPGCRKSFNVGDQYAGKTGPCPKCKTTIRVPTKQEQVQVHTPTAFESGGRSTTGALVTKPIARQQVKLEPVRMAIIAAAGILTLAIAWAGGQTVWGSLLTRTVGLLVLSPALVIAAYTFLRNDELEPYRGRSLMIRAVVCGAAYTALWGVYAYLVAAGVIIDELWVWLFVIPTFLAMGGLVSLAALDLDYGSGCFHYAFYVLVTVILGRVAGLGWVWDVGSGPLLM